MEVLEAGASVAQIYTGSFVEEYKHDLLTDNTTALVYGGVGKITSMKQEMGRSIQKSREIDA